MISTFRRGLLILTSIVLIEYDSMFCPANCGGRGICNYNAQFPVCECFDPDDTSNDCRNTPLMIVDPDDECSASNLLLHRKYKSSSWWNTATLTAALTTIALLALS